MLCKPNGERPRGATRRACVKRAGTAKPSGACRANGGKRTAQNQKCWVGWGAGASTRAVARTAKPKPNVGTAVASNGGYHSDRAMGAAKRWQWMRSRSAGTDKAVHGEPRHKEVNESGAKCIEFAADLAADVAGYGAWVVQQQHISTGVTCVTRMTRGMRRTQLGVALFAAAMGVPGCGGSSNSPNGDGRV